MDLENFLEDNYFFISECIKDKTLIYNGKIDNSGFYFYFSQKIFARLTFKECFCPFIQPFILERARYAERDGKTEYEFFDKKENELLKELNVAKTKKEKKEIEFRLSSIKNVKNNIDFFPKYLSDKKVNNCNFFVNSGRVATDLEVAKKFVVLDVETNGPRTKQDDLLSVSIYDPYTGVVYNRFLPLEMQPMILTTHINGITEEMIEEQTHITQEEFNEVVNTFNLYHRTILCYGGRKIPFDESFLRNYLSRRKIRIPNLVFEDIKHRFEILSHERGALKKDNVCRALGITGITDTHSSFNDCILEWQMFEKIYNKKLVFIGDEIYEYSKDYIIPVTYLNYRLAKNINADYPKIDIVPKLIYKYKITNSRIKKFPGNATGMAIENALKYVLRAEHQDNQEFLIENKNKLKLVGFVIHEEEKVPVELKANGLIGAINPSDKKIVDSINETSQIIIDNVQPVADFIKNELFFNEKLMDQELVITDNKVLALCDISSNTKVLEIKTRKIINEKGCLRPDILRQLFYQQKNRDVYIMQIDFNVGDDVPKHKKGICFYIYKIQF